MNHDLMKLRWELQRRDPEYRKAFTAYDVLKVRLEGKYGPVAGWTGHLLEGEKDAWHYDPPKEAMESDGAWRTRAIIENHDPRKSLIHEGLAQRWGLVRMYDPGFGFEQGVKFLPTSEPTMWSRISDIEGSPGEGEEGFPTTLYVRLDATRSASRQVAAVRKRLVAQQRRLRKDGLRWRTSLHAAKWPNYLKVFDGFQAGISTKELAKVVFPHVPDVYPDYLGQAHVRATHEQALLLVNGGYRHIVDTED
jgi:hypothetical protein